MAKVVREPDAPATPGEVLANGAKILGEVAIIPGTSLIADGDLRGGIAHGVIGVAAAIVFGPIGWLVVAADSYSRSVSGHYLHEHFVPERWIHRHDAAAA